MNKTPTGYVIHGNTPVQMGSAGRLEILQTPITLGPETMMGFDKFHNYVFLFQTGNPAFKDSYRELGTVDSACVVELFDHSTLVAPITTSYDPND